MRRHPIGLCRRTVPQHSRHPNTALVTAACPTLQPHARPRGRGCSKGGSRRLAATPAAGCNCRLQNPCAAPHIHVAPALEAGALLCVQGGVEPWRTGASPAHGLHSAAARCARSVRPAASAGEGEEVRHASPRAQIALQWAARASERQQASVAPPQMRQLASGQHSTPPETDTSV